MLNRVLVVGMVDKKSDNLVTSGNAVLRFEVIKYFNNLTCRFVNILPMNKNRKFSFQEKRFKIPSA
jgi:hypothetical protein